MAKGINGRDLPSQQSRFLPVEQIHYSPDDDVVVYRTMRDRLLNISDTPVPPLPLTMVTRAVDELAKDPRYQEVARTFDLYYDWLLPWRAAGRMTQ